MSDDGAAIDRLLALMARLRHPVEGCPWDVEQDFASIAPYTIEEAYEVADAIARRDLRALREELGDLLFQVVFHARMAEEQDAFRFADVVRDLTDKMIAELQKCLDEHGNTDFMLHIDLLQQPPWWQFWKRKIPVGPLSATPAQPLVPPDDEVSLIDSLLREFARKPVYGGGSNDETPRNEERRDDRSYDDNRPSSSSSDSDSFRGGGEIGRAHV